MRGNKPNAVCAICGKPYVVCRTCNDTNIHSWKTVTDTEECFEVFTILHQYGIEKISKEKAKEKLSHHDLDGFENYPSHIKRSIFEITAESKEEVKDTESKSTKTTQKTKTSNKQR